MKIHFLALLSLAVGTAPSFAQGPLAPPAGPPAPTMKSLQEIWDKVDALETRATALETQNAALRSQSTLLMQQLSAMVPTSRLAWLISTIDVSLSENAMAFGPDGQPAIAYNDPYGSQDLKFARFDGSQWTISVVENIGIDGRGVSLAFGPDGQPAISYLAGSTFSVRFARFDGTAWAVTVVHDAALAGSTSLAFGPDGQPAIAYPSRVNFQHHLNFARFDGSAWTAPVVVDPANYTGYSASLAFGPDGQPVIAYESGFNRTVKFARLSSGGWITSLVDDGGAAEVGFSIALAFGPTKAPAIAYRSYQDTGGGNSISKVKYAHLVGTAWSISTPEDPFQGATDPGFSVIDLAFGVDGQPAIAYNTGDGPNQHLALLRYSGTAWVFNMVDRDPDVGEYCTLAFGPDGQPAITYLDGTNYTLRFARKGVFTPTP